MTACQNFVPWMWQGSNRGAWMTVVMTAVITAAAAAAAAAAMKVTAAVGAQIVHLQFSSLGGATQLLTQPPCYASQVLCRTEPTVS
jgi:hypothetical protein